MQHDNEGRVGRYVLPRLFDFAPGEGVEGASSLNNTLSAMTPTNQMKERKLKLKVERRGDGDEGLDL